MCGSSTSFLFLFLFGFFFFFTNKIQNCSVQICQKWRESCDHSKAQNANNLLAHSVHNEIYRTKTLEVKQKLKIKIIWAEVSSFFFIFWFVCCCCCCLKEVWVEVIRWGKGWGTLFYYFFWDVVTWILFRHI